MLYLLHAMSEANETSCVALVAANPSYRKNIQAGINLEQLTNSKIKGELTLTHLENCI